MCSAIPVRAAVVLREARRPLRRRQRQRVAGNDTGPGQPARRRDEVVQRLVVQIIGRLGYHEAVAGLEKVVGGGQGGCDVHDNPPVVSETRPEYSAN